MWAAFRSDLKEFVSSVAEESTTVLSAIDSQLQDAEVTEEEEELLSKKVESPQAPTTSKEEKDGSESEDDDETKDAAEGATPDTAASLDGGVVYGEDGDVTFAGRDAGYSVTGIISTAQDEVARRMQCEETYTAPLLPLDLEQKYSAATRKKKKAAKEEKQGEEEKQEEEEKQGEEEEEELKTDAEEKEKGEEKQETEQKEEKEEKETEGTGETEGEENTADEGEEDDDGIPPEYADDPEAVEIIAFLQAFDIGEKTAEIAQTLEQYPDSVKVHFESLVPTTVTYEQFWQRYFYRCDADRIEYEWALEKERQRKARQEALSGGISTVRNLFGGAVKTLSEGLSVVEQTAAASRKPTEATAYERFQKQQLEADKKNANSTLSAVASSTTSLVGANMSALFGVGAGRRPPFVLNTALSDEVEDEEEEEDDEELGWDDDDEDDDQGQSPKRGEQQIEFSGSLADRLHQAEEERDLLQKTVEMQSKEIATLKITSDDRSSRAGDSDEVEKLKMIIFEKDSELAALRASLDDDEDGGDDEEEEDEENARKKDKETNKKQAAKLAAQKRDLDKMSTELEAKNSEVARLTQDLRMAKEKASQLKEELDSEKSRLEQCLEQVREELKTAKAAAEETTTPSVSKEEEKKEKMEEKEVKKGDSLDSDDDWGEDW